VELSTERREQLGLSSALFARSGGERSFEEVDEVALQVAGVGRRSVVGG